MKKRISILLSLILLTGCSASGNSASDESANDRISTEELTSITEEGNSSTTENEITLTTKEETEPVETEPPVVPKTVSFCAVGDNLIHSTIYNQARNGDSYDFSRAYEGVRDIIEEADVSVINQETLICNDMYEPSNYPMFNSPVALGDYMIDMGFDMFTLANNHCLDYGSKGLSYSLDYWEGKDVVYAGTYRNEEDKNNIRVGEYGGIKFSVLSYTDSLNGLSLPDDSELIIGRVGDLDKIIEDVKAAKEISDVCVVALHWGIEDSDVVEDWQREYAKALAEAGADIIIGNHPHVLRSIEMIPHEGGETICAYSLGNFISAQNVGANLISGILRFNVTVTEGETSPEISDVELIPIVTHYDYGHADLRLYKLSDYTPELAAVHGVKDYSTFGYDFIFDVLRKNIDEKFLVLEGESD